MMIKRIVFFGIIFLSLFVISEVGAQEKAKGATNFEEAYNILVKKVEMIQNPQFRETKESTYKSFVKELLGHSGLSITEL